MYMYRKRKFDSKRQSPRDQSGALDLDVRPGGLALWRIRRLKAFVEEHLSQSIRLVDLSDVVGLSVPHFSRAFGQSFDDSPHVYLIQRRLHRARHLMLTSDLKLSEVAVACGFSDQAHFCNLFRRDTGQTPAAWRHERRENHANPEWRGEFRSDLGKTGSPNRPTDHADVMEPRPNQGERW